MSSSLGRLTQLAPAHRHCCRMCPGLRLWLNQQASGQGELQGGTRSIRPMPEHEQLSGPAYSACTRASSLPEDLPAYSAATEPSRRISGWDKINEAMPEHEQPSSPAHSPYSSGWSLPVDVPQYTAATEVNSLDPLLLLVLPWFQSCMICS